MSEADFQRTVPENIKEHLNSWVRWHRRWRATHYTLGITATLGANTVASQPSFFRAVPYLLEGIAFVTAVCIALIIFLVPTRHTKGYVTAARVLTDACNRYQLEPTFIMKDFIRRLEERRIVYRT